MPRAIRPYATALAFVGGAVALRAMLQPLLGDSQVWITFWPAVFAASWWGGWRAGVTATVLSILAIALWIQPEALRFAITSPVMVGAIVFAVSAGVFSFVADASQRARAAERNARAEAVAANRAKDQFLAMLGHELRNPLTPVVSAAALLRLRGGPSRELDVIDRQVAHMARLIDDLLDIARIARGALEIRPERTELATAVAHAAEIAAPPPARGSARVELDVHTGLFVDADPARLRQIVVNLVTNAIKYSPPDEPVRVVGRRDRDRVILRVIDRGPGMDRELLARAFEPFVQGRHDQDRRRGGLGLGLAIARQLVELHGGTLTASSEGPGAGCELRLELPASPADVPAAPAATGVSPPASAAARPLRVLVVDDNVESATLLAELMATRGHDVRVAHDATAALEIASAFPPTLALLDIGLPGMDGYELARALRAHGHRAPLIAITGYAQPADRARAVDAGFAAHLAKPFSVARLDQVIDEVTPGSP